MLRKEIGFDTENLPSSIKPFAEGARIYDSSCSETAKTLYLDGKYRTFLKIDQAGKLEREYVMNAFLYPFKLAPQIITYFMDKNHDYLLTLALEGEDGISGRHLKNPKKLARVFAESLRLIHSLPQDRCPIQNRTSEMLQEATANAKRNFGDLNLIPEGVAMAYEKLLSLKACANNDVVLHGDYCLPNIIMQNYNFQGFVDLGTGGVGDRHYDLFWGIWTLNYNLKTDKYKDLFLDAYGRSFIDFDRLELCRLLAGLTE